MKKLEKSILKYLKKHVSQSRYEHSLRTARLAEKMCNLYGADPEKGYIAGIAHDICKNFPEEKMVKLAEQDGRTFSETEKNNFTLLHGRAAAVKIQSEFGIHDSEIIEAVSCHTFGLVSMGPLAKILFVADKIEPGRPHVTEEYLDSMLKKNLDDLVKTVIGENINYLEKKGKTVAPETYELYRSL